MVQYKNLCMHDINRSLFDNFIRRQIVTKCWRLEDGEWMIKDDPFVDDWSEDDYLTLTVQLRTLLAHNGFVYGAFYQDQLKGFVSAAPEWFGKGKEYLDLTNIYVSEDMRRQNIGKTLFLAAAEWARQKGAKKIYISAHSAVESQAFYRMMGCVEAETYNRKHVVAEPYDCQLEYKL